MHTFKKWYDFASYLISRLEWSRTPNHMGDYVYYGFLLNKKAHILWAYQKAPRVGLHEFS